jgi:uncharacterized lipoprotein YmbA
VRLCVAVPFIITVVARCGESPHSRFYVLTESRVATHQTATMRPLTIVALGAVTLPPALDRPQIARRLRDDEISYREYERWAGPLDEMVRRVLVADLDGRLPSGMSLIESDTVNSASLVVSVDILRFDADATGLVQLDARWEMLGRTGRLVGAPHNAFIVKPGSGPDAAAIATTMSRAVADLAGELATSVRRADAAHPR